MILPFETEVAAVCEHGSERENTSSRTFAQGSCHSQTGNDCGLDAWDIHNAGIILSFLIVSDMFQVMRQWCNMKGIREEVEGDF